MRVKILNGKDEGSIKVMTLNAANHMVTIGRGEIVEDVKADGEPKAKRGRKPKTK